MNGVSVGGFGGHGYGGGADQEPLGGAGEAAPGAAASGDAQGFVVLVALPTMGLRKTGGEWVAILGKLQ
jgi:hypothetical protein